MILFSFSAIYVVLRFKNQNELESGVDNQLILGNSNEDSIFSVTLARSKLVLDLLH